MSIRDYTIAEKGYTPLCIAHLS